MNDNEYLLDRELQYHLNGAVNWYRQDVKCLAYDEIQICIGLVYAAVAMHMLTVTDGLTILETLRRSEMCAGYTA